MHLVQSFVLLCLVATGIALPTNEDIRIQELKARGPGYSPKQPPLTTPWTNKVGTKPWPEYPRPLLERSAWKNLNGVWKYQSAASLDAVQQPPFGQELAQEVLIPSCLESGLSGRSCLVWYIVKHSINKYSQESKPTLLSTLGFQHPLKYLLLGRVSRYSSILEL
jgi:hypothetical protein